ncbi:MAG TPA: glutamate racemase [bacterium]|nr:glutamate racemase [bacterium]
MGYALSGDLPVGVFDSGIGGLTVLKEIRRLLPQEHLLYLGDTARVPYGTKSPEVVRRYSELNIRFLLEKKVKTVVVACNTASSLALDYLEELFPGIPIMGVIAPVISNLALLPGLRRIGVIGTTATIRSNRYQQLIRGQQQVEVLSQACPLFVPFVEEGLVDHSLTRQVIDHYLRDLKRADIDTLILACTHYPLLSAMIDEYFDHRVRIIDSAYYTALELKKMLENAQLLNPSSEEGGESFFVTDTIETFRDTATRFFGRPLSNIQHI